MIAQHVVVHGQVQGVGFRWWAAREADRLGVTGWVRNRPDGAVEALVEGEPEPVQTMVDELASGPRHAAVSGVEVEEATPTGSTRFVVEP
ncbi:Acylphosphatase [Cellulomonas sp. T2.31MG-18]|uniref:acylphosphatase n=1 Tax=unclassified Cellulomonas TaxID=2620175 RepID=UPI0030820344|nr:acylphosphatase [Cellulomonas sp. NTE-D12]